MIRSRSIRNTDHLKPGRGLTVPAGTHRSRLRSICHRALIERLVADVPAAGDMPSFSLCVYFLELPASAMAEFGRILPESGEEAAWAASFPSD